ncbi:putative PKHD-type hydroxylase, partial [Mucuna pruriens]
MDIQKLREYKKSIILVYPPLHKEIYTLDAENIFTPSFIGAIKENTEASFRSIMAEPIPGIFVFEMLQPQFCEKLISEVDHFERWAHDNQIKIMKPNEMNNYGAVLDDFGLEAMLDKFMSDFICPISRVFYAELGGSSLDSHHGFVVEYGINKGVEMALHVDDAEVSLNICLRKEFTGGELFFRGVRCEQHINTGSKPGEIFDYCHVPGTAILHPGRHRHGARPITSGSRMNLVLWCRSSAFRELKKNQSDFSSWCIECRHKKATQQPLHKEIYTRDPENFFTPSFLEAIQENTEASFRSIMAEPCPGIYTFKMLQPHFCKMLISEENLEYSHVPGHAILHPGRHRHGARATTFGSRINLILWCRRWAHDNQLSIMKPNANNKNGAVLDDFGLDAMLDRFMSDFICPLSRVFYTELGGSSLDSHHGFVVEYGNNKDVELGFHVDDAEVSLNICLGKEFSGGQLFFRGARCDEHVNSETKPGEMFDYSHVPGHAILHSGRHRHGARPTTSGNRMNLILWCRSSAFRELKKKQSDFSSWCGECRRNNVESESLSVTPNRRLKKAWPRD